MSGLEIKLPVCLLSGAGLIDCEALDWLQTNQAGSGLVLICSILKLGRSWMDLVTIIFASHKIVPDWCFEVSGLMNSLDMTLPD